VLDGEMGTTLPYEYHKVPALFFQALRIVRKVKAEGRKDGS